MWALLKIVLVLFGPRLLFSFRSLPSIATSVRKFFHIRTKRSKIELVLELCILFSVVLHTWRFLAPSSQQGFFSATKISKDAPAYLMRNEFRLFIQKMQLEHPLLRYSDGHLTYPGNDGLQKKIERLEVLSNELKINENRNIYRRFGEEAYLNCEVCNFKKPIEFLWYLAPRALLEYFVLLVFASILGYSVYQKYRWCLVAISLCTIGAIAEVVFLFSPDLLGADFFYLIADNSATDWDVISWYRSFLLATLGMAIILFDLPPHQSEIETLLKATRQIIGLNVVKSNLSRIICKVTSSTNGISECSTNLDSEEIAFLAKPGVLAKIDELISSG